MQFFRKPLKTIFISTLLLHLNYSYAQVFDEVRIVTLSDMSQTTCSELQTTINKPWFQNALAQGAAYAIRNNDTYQYNCFKFFDEEKIITRSDRSTQASCNDLQTTINKPWFQDALATEKRYAITDNKTYQEDCFKYFTGTKTITRSDGLTQSSCSDLQTTINKPWFQNALASETPYTITDYQTYQTQCFEFVSELTTTPTELLALTEPLPLAEPSICDKWDDGGAGHYLRVMEDPDRKNGEGIPKPKVASEEVRNLLRRLREADSLDLFSGFLVNLHWGDIETYRDNYTFEIIDNILNQLTGDASHMKIVVMVHNVTFKNGCYTSFSPNYLFGHNVKGNPRGDGQPSDKCFIEFWDDSVTDRFIKLNEELLSNYESNPKFLGVLLTGEGAIGIPNKPAGFDDMVFGVYEKVAVDLGEKFPNMILSYGTNWPNKEEYIDNMADFLINRVPAGSFTWPDTVPPFSAYPQGDKSYSHAYTSNIRTEKEDGSRAYHDAHYRVAARHSNNMAIIAGTQNPQVVSSLAESNRIYDFLNDTIGAQIIVWEPGHYSKNDYSESHYKDTTGVNYLTESVIPAIQGHNNGELKNTACPYR